MAIEDPLDRTYSQIKLAEVLLAAKQKEHAGESIGAAAESAASGYGAQRVAMWS